MEALLLGMLVTGLASGVHCAGMCGGFASAFAAAGTIRLHDSRRSATRRWLDPLVLSAGRIASYTLAGALAGTAGGALTQALPVQTVLFVLANVMLILTGFYVAGVNSKLARLEALAAPAWRLLQPRAAKLFGAKGLWPRFAAGMLWGFLPCGLVYAALAAAALAGSPARGAATMLAFGVGTLPTLLTIGVAAVRLRAWSASRATRLAAGALILGFGAYGLARAEDLGQALRNAMLCL